MLDEKTQKHLDTKYGKGLWNAIELTFPDGKSDLVVVGKIKGAAFRQALKMQDDPKTDGFDFHSFVAHNACLSHTDDTVLDALFEEWPTLPSRMSNMAFELLNVGIADAKKN